jgi:hypothetical protein
MARQYRFLAAVNEALDAALCTPTEAP